MLSLIAKKDLLEFTRDGRLFWAGGVVVVLLFTALAVGWQRQREIDAERVAAQGLDYQDWIHQDPRHPHNAAHQGMHVFKPEPPLSIVDPGIEPYVGATIWLQAHQQSEVKFRPAQDATGLQRFGELSPAWVLQILGPLLVIVLGFNAFAGEREQGTMRQTLSLGVTPRHLLWGKALALLASLGMLLVPAALVAAVAVGFGAETGMRTDAIVRLGSVLVGYSTYLGIAVFLVLGVSAIATSSRVALIALLGLWIAGAMMAPRVMSDLSRVWFPSPSRMEFNANLGADVGRARTEAWQQHFGITTRWGTDLPLDKWGIALQVDDQASYPVLDRHFGHLWDTFERQQRVQEWAGLVFPLLAVRAFSMGIAGTDFAHHREFSVAAEQHRRVIQDMMSADLVVHADARKAKHFDYHAGSELWTAVPSFRYSTPSAWWALRHNARSLAILFAALALSIAFAHIAVPRRGVS